MRLTERSFNTKLMRPKPMIYQDEGGDFILIMTPWGSAEDCQKVMDYVVQFLLTAKQDAELTTPFQNILNLSDEANDLRVATLMANDYVFRNTNQGGYNLIVETLFLSQHQNHVAWCQMGCPHLIVKKNQGLAQPISLFPEFNSDLLNFPLPQQFVGSEPTIAPRCGDLYLDKQDEIILLSSSVVPQELWNLDSSNGLEDWTQQMVQKDGSQPFWLGRLELD